MLGAATLRLDQLDGRGDHTLTLDPEPPAPGEEPEREDKPKKEPSFWSGFTDADLRSFVMGFAGTVIGGILLVMVIAVAVLASR